MPQNPPLVLWVWCIAHGHLELLWTAQRCVWVSAWGIVGGAWIRRHLESCEETRGLWSHIRKRMDEYEEYSNCLGLFENLGAFWDSDSIFKLILTQCSWLPRSNDGVSMKIPTLDDAWLPPAWTRWSWSRRAQTRCYKEQIGLWAFQCTSYNSARHTGAREAEIWWAKLFERFVSANHGYHVDTILYVYVTWYNKWMIYHDSILYHSIPTHRLCLIVEMTSMWFK